MPNSNRGSTGFRSDEFDQEYDRPSKSQLKREMTALQKLGEELVAEPSERIKKAPLPEDVRDAILECQRIKDHEGRRRQMQYVGKKMRTLDAEELDQIKKAIDRWHGLSKANVATLHLIENQREKLLKDDSALTELLAKYPSLDVQRLRTLIRNAKKELAESKPPKAYREIFQILKEIREAEIALTKSAQPEEDDEDELNDE